MAMHDRRARFAWHHAVAWPGVSLLADPLLERADIVGPVKTDIPVGSAEGKTNLMPARAAERHPIDT